MEEESDPVSPSGTTNIPPRVKRTKPLKFSEVKPPIRSPSSSATEKEKMADLSSRLSIAEVRMERIEKEIQNFKQEIKSEIQTMKSDIQTMKSDMHTNMALILDRLNRPP
jgi:molecular chaperone GrpE (heat shock protein)